MRKVLLSAITFLLTTVSVIGQDFSIAYQQYPNIPAGMLEGMAWSRTRMHDMQGDTEHESCSGLPHVVGIFGLIEEGHNWFSHSLATVSTVSGYSVSSIKDNTQIEILAVARTISQYINDLPANPDRSVEETVYEAVLAFSELPTGNNVQAFSRDVQAYEVLKFMNNADMQETYGFSQPTFNLELAFGNNLALQTASKLIINLGNIRTNNGYVFKPKHEKSTEFGPAIWNPAPSCNYSSRGGTAISAITIHTIQGPYSSAINWSQNCASNVSFHYVIRSSDGQVTQMCTEATKAWHVGSENPYTIGYEHEGYVAQTGWYTTAMYNSSAALSRDIVNSGYGINPLRTYYGAASVEPVTLGSCLKIKGHMHYPNQDHNDPGINWNWEKYYRLINNVYTPTVVTSNGPFTDNGGAAANYSDDLRKFWLFQPTGASTVTISFTNFATELGYDRVFIYNGDDITDPLLGSFTGTTIPPSFTSTGGSLLVEFRSDCATNLAGWGANITSVGGGGGPVDVTAPTTAITAPSTWVTSDPTFTYTDADNATVAARLHLVSDRTSSTTEWQSNPSKRFLYEQFTSATDTWTAQTGTFTNTAGEKTFADEAQQNYNTWKAIPQLGTESYLYHWKQKISGTGTTRRSGVHFFCSDATLPNRGNSYLAIFRENTDIFELYKVTNDVLTSVGTAPATIPLATTMDCKVYYNPTSGKINVYLNDAFIFTYTDPTPFTTGSSVSYRAAGCSGSFDEFQVYHGRAASALLNVGPAGHFRSQGSDVGLVKSIVIDANNNLSVIDQELIDVDWSKATPTTVNDGAAADLDVNTTTTWTGNWTSADAHSGVASYQYAIGTTAGATNTLAWVPTAANNFSTTLTGLVVNQMYYLSVKVINGAGLDTVITSDGMTYTGTGAGLDNIAPTTAITPINTWVTNTTTATFTDADNQVNPLKKLILVADRVDLDETWQSNTNKGFMYEEFNLTDTWTNQTGTWLNVSQSKGQTDSVSQNTNAFFPFIQDNTKSYLYQWSQKISGAGVARRAGVHFFCENGTLDNRGASYLIIFRDNINEVQLFESSSANILTSLASVTYNIPNDFWIDIKTYYSPITGEVIVYINDVKVLTYIDPTPLTAGTAVSFRTGGCQAQFDSFKVYHSRNASEVLQAGATGHFREQGVETGLIQSIVIDAANNISANPYEYVDVDYTAPIDLVVNDGAAVDQAISPSYTWEANWDAYDAHSTVVFYEYALGSTAGATNIINWTPTTAANFMQNLQGTITPGSIYYVSVKAINGAGLISNLTSNGMQLATNVALETSILNSINMFPNPASDNVTFSIEGNKTIQLTIFDATGRILLSKSIANGATIDLTSFSAGTYNMLLSSDGAVVRKPLIKK
jgi:N-acetyl-anhydromuramyl-L-alanine amidase AmpD